MKTWRHSRKRKGRMKTLTTDRVLNKRIKESKDTTETRRGGSDGKRYREKETNVGKKTVKARVQTRVRKRAGEKKLRAAPGTQKT